jgi:hypothetical protein
MGSLFIISTLPVSILFRLFLAISVSIYALFIIYSNYLLKSSTAVTQLLFNEDGWHISSKNTQQHVELDGNSTVTSWVSILRFKALNTGQTFVSLLFKDSIKTDDYRRLIVLLRTTRAYRAERLRKARFN